MKGIEEFLKLFGDITVLQVVEFVLACVFMIFVYKQVRKYFQQKIDDERQRTEKETLRDAQIKEALDAVHKYPEYRQQSIEIQGKLEQQINELKEIHQDTVERLNAVGETVARMEETETRRERSKMRDTLLQNHRYYTSPITNPSHSWTRVEAETFWELYAEYEAAGGNGHMHTDVAPEMRLLTVVDTGVQRNN